MIKDAGSKDDDYSSSPKIRHRFDGIGVMN